MYLALHLAVCLRLRSPRGEKDPSQLIQQLGLGLLLDHLSCLQLDYIFLTTGRILALEYRGTQDTEFEDLPLRIPFHEDRYQYKGMCLMVKVIPRDEQE